MDDKDFYNKLLPHYNNIKNTISPVGKAIEQKLKDNGNNTILIYSGDILKRIQCNIRSLVKLGIIEEYNCVAYKLILRCIHSDIIEALSILIRDEESRNDILKRSNEYAVWTLGEWAKEKKEFYNNFGDSIESNVSISAIYNTFSEFVNEKGDFRKSVRKSIADHARYLKDKSDVVALKYFHMLYSNYRLLSLSEHYSSATSLFSYNIDADKLLFLDLACWLDAGVTMLTEIIKEWVETGTFVVTDTQS